MPGSKSPEVRIKSTHSGKKTAKALQEQFDILPKGMSIIEM